MKKHFLPGLTFLTILLFVPVTNSRAKVRSAVHVDIDGPPGILRMGDRPVFKGSVTNIGGQNMRGLVVYLSLVSLESGHEHPVDLEDWSAQKAVRIERLAPGETSAQDWSMRLISAGRFGVALTVVNPQENKPTVSDLICFNVLPKPTLASGRVLPVAIGEPLILLALFGLSAGIRTRSRQLKKRKRVRP